MYGSIYLTSKYKSLLPTTNSSKCLNFIAVNVCKREGRHHNRKHGKTIKRMTSILTLELNVTLIFSITSTNISSLFLPPGSLATTDFVIAVPGIRLVPCCKYRSNKSTKSCMKSSNMPAARKWMDFQLVSYIP